MQNKGTVLSQGYTFQLRGDAFNVWIHTNSLSVNASFTSPTFGAITSYRDPRTLQIAAKFNSRV